MRKSGQARVLTEDQQHHLFDVIAQHRHPEKNRAMMMISFKLGLRAQEIALLEVGHIAKLRGDGKAFRLNEIMALPASVTKGADAMGRSKSQYRRTSVTMSIEEFRRVIREVEKLSKAGGEINPVDYLPVVRQHHGKARDLPMVDQELREALTDYLGLRLDKADSLKPSDQVFVTQKGGPYSPNTLQEHMALMLRGWAGIEKASSHSGRRSVITNVIHKQGKSVKVAQKIAGHVNPSTTLIYEEPPEEQLVDALKDL